MGVFSCTDPLQRGCETVDMDGGRGHREGGHRAVQDHPGTRVVVVVCFFRCIVEALCPRSAVSRPAVENVGVNVCRRPGGKGWGGGGNSCDHGLPQRNSELNVCRDYKWCGHHYYCVFCCCMACFMYNKRARTSRGMFFFS